MKTLYPTTRTENLEYRANLVSDIAKDRELAAAAFNKCCDGVDGLLFWLNTFCWIYEPGPDQQRKHGSKTPHLPFITYPYQDDYVRDDVYNAINTGEDMLTEKSRDMGATWLVLCTFLWFWQFGGGGNDFLLGSRKEVYVDKFGDMDTLFEKLRYQLKRQPTFLLPEGFNITIHAKYMNLINPDTGSNIAGEANNMFFGTGGRRKAVLMDEFAKWLHTDSAAWQSCSDVTLCKLAISSARGKRNHFYRLRSGKAGKIKKVRLFWKIHPHKSCLDKFDEEDWASSEKELVNKITKISEFLLSTNK